MVKDQARILLRDAENMRDASPQLKRFIEKHVNNLFVPTTNSFFRPISSEKRGLDGKRVHMALIDELHEHPSALVVDKMRAGTKGRRQALIFEITNSGYDRNSVCYQHHDYSEKVLSGIIENDSWFAYVCQLDVCEKCASAGLTIEDRSRRHWSLTHFFQRQRLRAELDFVTPIWFRTPAFVFDWKSLYYTFRCRTKLDYISPTNQPAP